MQNPCHSERAEGNVKNPLYFKERYLASLSMTWLLNF